MAKRTMHKSMTDDEYQEHIASGYPIDENDLQESYRKRQGQASGTPSLRPGMKAGKPKRMNPLLAVDEDESRAGRTTSSISKAFGGQPKGPSPEEKANEGISGAWRASKKYIKDAIYGTVPEAENSPKKKKRLEE